MDASLHPDPMPYQPPPDPRDHPVLVRPSLPEYPETPETIARAKDAREDELRRLHAMDALTIIVEQYGARRVQTWLRNIATLRGETL